MQCSKKYQTTYVLTYSKVPNKQAYWNKRAGLDKNAILLVYLLSKSINEQGGIFVYYMKNCEHALLLGTSEYRIAIKSNILKTLTFTYGI